MPRSYPCVQRGHLFRCSLALIAICLTLGVTHAQAQTKAYLVNGSSNAITVLDTSNDAVREQ